MPKYGYIVVEGPHDVEFVYRLLSPFGFNRVQVEQELDTFLEPLIPRTFPEPGGKLQKRISVPLFLQSPTHAVAVHAAGGDSRLVEAIEESGVDLDYSKVTGIGILLDSDKNVAPAERYEAVKDEMAKKGFGLPAKPGEIADGIPKFGAYVIPDNVTQGTLEELLLESAQTVYPQLLASATVHVNTALADATLTGDDTSDIKKPAGKKKAIVGSMASVLRPGKAVQVSVQDNRWFRGAALAIPRIKAVQDFLVALLELA